MNWAINTKTMCLRASPLVLQQSFIKLHTDVIQLLKRTALRFKPGLHVYIDILLLIYQPFLFPLAISKWTFGFPYFSRMNKVFSRVGTGAMELIHDYKTKHISASNSKPVGEFDIITSFFCFLLFILYHFSPSQYGTITTLNLFSDRCKHLLLTLLTTKTGNWTEQRCPDYSNFNSEVIWRNKTQRHSLFLLFFSYQ